MALSLKLSYSYSLNDISLGVWHALGAIFLRNLARDILENKAAYDINIESPSKISVFFLIKKNYIFGSYYDGQCPISKR